MRLPTGTNLSAKAWMGSSDPRLEMSKVFTCFYNQTEKNIDSFVRFFVFFFCFFSLFLGSIISISLYFYVIYCSMMFNVHSFLMKSSFS